jgi:hypothetical protein
MKPAREPEFGALARQWWQPGFHQRAFQRFYQIPAVSPLSQPGFFHWQPLSLRLVKRPLFPGPMPTDTSEQGLEALISRAMTGLTHLLEPPHQTAINAVPVSGGTGWLLGDPRHYDRNFCLDLVPLQGFLEATQPAVAEAVATRSPGSPTRWET